MNHPIMKPLRGLRGFSRDSHRKILALYGLLLQAELLEAQNYSTLTKPIESIYSLDFSSQYAISRHSIF